MKRFTEWINSNNVERRGNGLYLEQSTQWKKAFTFKELYAFWLKEYGNDDSGVRIVETTVYQIQAHPDPSKVYEWIRNNWHDLNQAVIDDVIASLEALTLRIDGQLDYSISANPDRGEFLKITDYNAEILTELNAEDSDLTGAWSDRMVINALKDNDMHSVLTAIHEDTEYQYLDNSLRQHCMANEYEFVASGELFAQQ